MAHYRHWKLRYFILSLPLFVGGLGMLGMWRTETFRAGDCQAKYRRYLLEPLLADYLSCEKGEIPCGRAKRSGAKAAHAQLVDCLCRNPAANRQPAQLYLEEVHCTRCRDFAQCPECRAPDLSRICPSSPKR